MAGPRIQRVFDSRPFELLTPGADASDFEAAFVSRDVTGRSTKQQLEPQTQVFHDALRRARSLKWVHIHSAGADRPIYPELRARGVSVTTSSGANASIVAQTALAGMLALNRRFPLLMEQQRRRQWKSLIGELPRDLAGQAAVMVGWGPIGRTLAGWLEALGVRVMAVRNSVAPTYEELTEVARQADWLVIACPLTERTRGLVGEGVLDALPPGAHVVNVGRGEVIIEADLVAALRSGKVAGAFLDVFEHEPLSAGSPLWDMPNVIVTPHSAGISGGNEARVLNLFIHNLERFLHGQIKG